MKPILIHPVYFGNIAHYVAMAQADSIVLEMCDNYQKQTFRNRTYIATPAGKLSLNIPVKHSSTGERGSREKVHQKYKDVQVENDFRWQKEHWKSIQMVYRTSPYFEFYEDDIAPLYEKKATYLLDFNLKTFELINELISFTPQISHTTIYSKQVAEVMDYRNLAEVKKESPYSFDTYTQVLEKHHNFLPNLSILDLLFNEGPNALNYLEKQKL